MKKQDIFEILCGEYLNEMDQKKENFNKCISNFDKCIEDYIIPYLNDNKEKFGYIFDLNSNDETTKEKTTRLLNAVISNFKEVVSLTPEYFLSLQKEKNYEYACHGICFAILIGNDINELVK